MNFFRAFDMFSNVIPENAKSLNNVFLSKALYFHCLYTFLRTIKDVIFFPLGGQEENVSSLRMDYTLFHKKT